jgi:uncharacterized membrane protein YczE
VASESRAVELARREVPGNTAGAARRSLAYAGRLVILVAGLFCFAFGIMLTLKSDLGLGPWDVFHQGVSRHSGLSFGTASIGVGFGVLLLSWLLGTRPGVGTVANMVLVGLFIDLIEWSGLLPSFAGRPWPARLAVDVLGVAVVGFGSALYIKANLGAGPRDSLMLALARRLRGRVALVRGALELVVLVAGYLLGGTAGLGTLVFALGIGPAVGLAFRLLRVRVEGHKSQVAGRESTVDADYVEA